MRISDWSSDVCSSDLDEDLAAVGLVEAVEDAHQRRLAGAVLADDAVDGSGLHRQADVAVRLHRAEGLADVAQLDGQRCLVRRAAAGDICGGGQGESCRAPGPRYAARGRADRKRGVWGKSVSGRVNLGGRRLNKK